MRVPKFSPVLTARLAAALPSRAAAVALACGLVKSSDVTRYQPGALSLMPVAVRL